MPERELDTAVVRRMLALRHVSLLDGVELHELATLAQNLTETELAPGTVLTTAGEHSSAVHFVLEGAVAAATGARSWRAHDVLGALEVLADRPARDTTIALATTRTLRLEADELEDLLDDNFGILVATIRATARLVLTRPPRTLEPAGPTRCGPLGLVDRLFLLRQQLPFSRSRVKALATLARTSHEIAWETDATITRTGELASEGYVLLEGEVREMTTAPVAFHPGDPIALLEMLAGQPHRATLQAITPVRALASTGADLLDVLEDHTDFGFEVLANLSREALDRAAP